MRLVCPNCDAQYEVDDSAIPAAGRDVQCSACGHGWFHRPDPRPAAAAAVAAAADPVTARPAPPAAARDPSDRLAPAEPGTVAGAVAPAGTPPRRPLDETVKTVLREEALREAAARQAEAAQRPETRQATMPGRAAARPAHVSAAAMAVDPARPAARRELLPDIEEINSSLSASSDRRGPLSNEAADNRPGRGRSGFRTGFLSMLTCIALLALLYVLSPLLAERMPGLAPAMAEYVEVVDGLRTSLSEAVQRAGTALRDMAGQAG
jgi:predicted Zn finger-like uncharacterized protein